MDFHATEFDSHFHATEIAGEPRSDFHVTESSRAARGVDVVAALETISRVGGHSDFHATNIATTSPAPATPGGPRRRRTRTDPGMGGGTHSDFHATEFDVVEGSLASSPATCSHILSASQPRSRPRGDVHATERIRAPCHSEPLLFASMPQRATRISMPQRVDAVSGVSPGDHRTAPEGTPDAPLPPR